MYLYIDTTEKDSFDIALLCENSVIKKKRVQSHRKHSEKLLKSIEIMLKSAKIQLKSIKGILTVKGPGSFTSLRIGVSIANALAFGLNIRIAGIDKIDNLDTITSSIKTIFKKEKKEYNVVIPIYGSDPHII